MLFSRVGRPAARMMPGHPPPRSSRAAPGPARDGPSGLGNQADQRLGALGLSGARIGARDAPEEHRATQTAKAMRPEDHSGDLQTALRGTGPRPLPAALRAAHEDRLGADLADVTLRTGRDAGAAARALGTRAFAHGRQVVLDETALRGEAETAQVLAHELSHVARGETAGIIRRDPRPPDWDNTVEGRRYTGFNLPSVTGCSDDHGGFRVGIEPVGSDPRVAEIVVYFGGTRDRQAARVTAPSDLVTPSLLSVSPGHAGIDLTGSGEADLVLSVTPNHAVTGLDVSVTAFGQQILCYLLESSSTRSRPRYVEGRGFYAGTTRDGRRYYRIPFSESHPSGPFYMDENGESFSPAMQARAEALNDAAADGILLGFLVLAGIATIELVAGAGAAGVGLETTVGTGAVGLEGAAAGTAVAGTTAGTAAETTLAGTLMKGAAGGLVADVAIQGTSALLIDDYEYSPAQTGVSVLTGGLGGWMARAGYSIVAIGGATGAAYPVGYRATQDVAAGEYSGTAAYVRDATTGALIGVLVGGVFSTIRGGGVQGHQTPETLYHHSNAVQAIDESGVIWGTTEGRVYATTMEEMTGFWDPVKMGIMPGRTPSGTIALTDDAAQLFRLHPSEGWFSHLKQLAGQYVTSEVGSHMTIQSSTMQGAETLIISEAGLAQQSAARFWFSQSRHWGRRLGIDWGVPAVGAAGMLGSGSLTDVPTGRNLVPWETPPIYHLLMALQARQAAAGAAPLMDTGEEPLTIWVVPNRDVGETGVFDTGLQDTGAGGSGSGDWSGGAGYIPIHPRGGSGR